MSQTFDQFVRFTTDAAGLERTFRLFQSIAQILSSYTLPLECLLFLLACLPASALGGAGGAGKSTPDAAATRAVLVGLRVKFNVARRYFRVFRFLESFGAAQKAYVSLSGSGSGSGSSSGLGLQSSLARRALWIDVFGRTFNGMYLLLEASTFLDVQRVEGLALWTPEMEDVIIVEGQRFWLFSLVCGVLAGLLRIADVLASAPAPVPVTTVDEKEGIVKDGDGDEKIGDGENGDSSDRKRAKGEQIDYLAWKKEAQAKISNLGRRVVSDALDITLPGSIVGWVPVSTGTVGLAMFVTTVLTSMDIWERCGREVAGNKK